MGKESFREAMRRIIRGLAPKWLTDEQINNETPRPPKNPNPPSHEQALAERKGAGCVQQQHALIAEAIKAKEDATAAIKMLKGQVDKAFSEMVGCLKKNLPEVVIAGLKALGIGALFRLAIKGEVVLLVTAVADWMGVQDLSSKAGGDLSSIAAVLLTFLGLLTHWAWEHREEAKGRFCGIALVAVALMLSFLRAAQASFDGAFDKGVFFLFCFALSIGGPIPAAWGLTCFWPPLRQFLTSLVDLFSAFAVLQKEKSKVAEQKARVANAHDRIEAVLDTFTCAYEDAVFGAQG